MSRIQIPTRGGCFQRIGETHEIKVYWKPAIDGSIDWLIDWLRGDQWNESICGTIDAWAKQWSSVSVSGGAKYRRLKFWTIRRLLCYLLQHTEPQAGTMSAMKFLKCSVFSESTSANYKPGLLRTTCTTTHVECRANAVRRQNDKSW